MTFKEFNKAIKKDARMMELLNRCDPSCELLTDAETLELMERAKLASSSANSDDSCENS